MNIQQLQQSYENRIKDIRGFIYKQTRQNEDFYNSTFCILMDFCKELQKPSIQCQLAKPNPSHGSVS